MNPTDSRKVTLNLLATEVNTGQRAYITSTELTISETVASIVFRESPKKIPTQIQKRASATIARCDPSSTEVKSITWLKDLAFHQVLGENVKRVIINYYIPLSGPLISTPSYTAPYRAWIALIPQIGSIIRIMFPNLIPEESNFNVHVGVCHYYDEMHLLPDAPPNEVNLKPRWHIEPSNA